jgi:DNA-binding beta-propeller fold protein YncE
LLRTIRTGGGALAVDDRTGRVFVASIDGDSVSMLDAHSGAVLRTIGRIGIRPLAVDARAGHIFVPGVRRLGMLDTRTGRLLRTAALTTTTGAVVLTMDEADGRLFVSDDVRFAPFHGVVRVFDTRTGAFVHTVAVGRPSNPSIVVVDERSGRAFITNGLAGTVSVLDARRAVVVRTVAIGPHPAALAVDQRRGRVVVVGAGTVSGGTATRPGRVSVLDARRGAILSSAAAGWGPIAVAADERTGHALVTNAGGAMRVPDFWGRVPSWVRGWLPFLPRPSFRTRPVPASVSVIDATC